MRRFIGADSLAFISMNGLYRAMGKPATRRPRAALLRRLFLRRLSDRADRRCRAAPRTAVVAACRSRVNPHDRKALRRAHGARHRRLARHRPGGRHRAGRDRCACDLRRAHRGRAGGNGRRYPRSRRQRHAGAVEPQGFRRASTGWALRFSNAGAGWTGCSPMPACWAS